jgi:hypothetical protein
MRSWLRSVTGITAETVLSIDECQSVQVRQAAGNPGGQGQPAAGARAAASASRWNRNWRSRW